MKNKIFLVCFFVFNSSVFSQSQPNSLYLELFGNGVIYSINYDKLFSNCTGGRIGFMFLWGGRDGIAYRDIAVLPVMFHYFISFHNHKIEFGIGPLIALEGASEFEFLGVDNLSSFGIGGTATIGYRFQKEEGGFLFRIGFTPLFGISGLIPSGGLSFGIGF
jgi:hypothetical protein